MNNKSKKTLEKIKSGGKNIRFSDMVKLVEDLGFTLVRIRGSHHLYNNPEIDELINLQPDGGKAKNFEIKQVMTIVKKYNLED